jgi:hypothetical protein
MSDLIRIETAATHLRRCLNVAPTPELQVLCTLEFAGQCRGLEPLLEPYIREFVPTIAAAARACRAEEFFIDESEAIARAAATISQAANGAVSGTDIEAIRSLSTRIEEYYRSLENAGAGLPDDRHILLNCLLVEDYPELGLPARGRILTLRVTISELGGTESKDECIVDNPVTRITDRFRDQADTSVAVARSLAHSRFGFTTNKHFQVKYKVESTDARFTGDSLGVAFAVGAMAAFVRHEVLRERLSVSSDAAFSGALNADGSIAPIDAEGLRTKIHRAFHSSLRTLVIPRQHLTDAWEYLAALEKLHPGRKLELKGADTLDEIISDPRLVITERVGLTHYVTRKAIKAGRTPWVEVPLLLILLGVLSLLILTPFDHTPYTVDTTRNGFEVLNQWGHVVWKKTLNCEGGVAEHHNPCWKIADILGDKRDEVLIVTPSSRWCPDADHLFVYNDTGALLYRRDCRIFNQYPGDQATDTSDTSHAFLWSGAVYVVKPNGKVRIITVVDGNDPARSHFKIWDAQGNLAGWYINPGCAGSGFQGLLDYNGDGQEDILVQGYQNRTRGTGVWVMRSDSSRGAGPPYADPRYPLEDVVRGNQLVYVAMPTTDVGLIDMVNAQSDFAGIVRTSGNGFIAQTGESGARGRAVVDYHLDKRLRVIDVDPGDAFVARRADLVRQGKLPEVALKDYSDRLRDSVKYWTDSGWVTEAQLRAAGQ